MWSVRGEGMGAGKGGARDRVQSKRRDEWLGLEQVEWRVEGCPGTTGRGTV